MPRRSTMSRKANEQPSPPDVARWSHDAGISEGSAAEIRAAILSKIVLVCGKDADQATPRDWYIGAALTLRDRIVHRWLQSRRDVRKQGSKQVCYLSLEFLIGR